MNRIEDERLKFYLRHQELIDTWAKLAELVPDQVHEFLHSCNDALKKLAPELGPKVEYSYWEHKQWPTYGFQRPSWNTVDVGIGIQWFRPKAAFKGEYAAKSGVWLYTDGKKPDERLIEVFRTRFNEPRKGFARGNAWQVAVRSECPPNADYWENLDPYRNSLLDSVRLAWTLYANDIDKVLREMET